MVRLRGCAYDDAACGGVVFKFGVCEDGGFSVLAEEVLKRGRRDIIDFVNGGKRCKWALVVVIVVAVFERVEIVF